MCEVRVILLSLCFLRVAGAIAAAKDFIICANSVGFIAHIAEDGGPEDVSTESPYHKCENNYCYTLWQEDPANGTVTVMGQGCWDISGDPNECDRTECLADKKPPKAMNNTKFCCCSTNMCNVNFTDAYVPPPTTDNKSMPEVAQGAQISLFVWLVVVVVVLFLSLALIISLMANCCWMRKPKKSDVECGQQQQLSPSVDYSLDKLKLLNVIGRGRYGCVWRGVVDEEEVAVKVFAAHHRNYFLNEHEMYKVAGENSSLLKFYGGGDYALSGGGPADYLLLLSLEQECLQEYLKKHILDLTQLSKMSLGVAKGLAHLHTDLGKPCIAHRDINTRNILVRRDMSCCICDLGLAVIPRRMENKALSEAGTLRYMAPEVLEGAVNLRDCESALKQIDVYALGLVLWEMGMRCTDMINGDQPAPYQPPFYKEAGENPTLEQMQTLISRHKARPLWPMNWKDTAAARLLCETAEDCWDQDAEARLTSLCVVERLLELPLLKGRASHPLHHPPASPTPLINNNHLHDHPPHNQFDVSLGTVETLLSPSEEQQQRHCKNSNQFAPCVPVPAQLQPYQGRNPCLERNLLSGSSDSLLIDKSSKHCGNSGSGISESQNLLTNDFLNFQLHQRAMPIPYLQNAVHNNNNNNNNNTDGIVEQSHSNSQLSMKTDKQSFKWRLLKLFQTTKKPKQAHVKLNTKLINSQNGITTTSVLTSICDVGNKQRPSNLPLTYVNNSGVTQLLKCNNKNLSRQRSLEQFNEIFSSTSDLSHLKDPSQRVKTPGDVPPSVRRTRGKAAKESAARFSLYDDRMMICRVGSAPDLEPPQTTLKPSTAQLNDGLDRDSVSSF